MQSIGNQAHQQKLHDRVESFTFHIPYKSKFGIHFDGTRLSDSSEMKFTKEEKKKKIIKKRGVEIRTFDMP